MPNFFFFFDKPIVRVWQILMSFLVSFSDLYFHTPFFYFFNLHSKKKDITDRPVEVFNYLLYIYASGLFIWPENFNCSKKKFYKKCKLDENAVLLCGIVLFIFLWLSFLFLFLLIIHAWYCYIVNWLMMYTIGL